MQHKLTRQGLEGHALLLEKYSKQLATQASHRRATGDTSWDRYSLYLAGGLREAAPKVRWATIKAAQMASEVAKSSLSPALKEAMGPPREQPLEIPMKTKIALGSAQVAAAAAATVCGAACESAKVFSGAAMDGLVYNSPFGQESEEPSVRAAKRVGLELLSSGYEVFLGVEEAKGIMVEAGGEVAADLVGHRYGEQAGDAARQGADVVSTTYRALRGRKHIKPKVLLARYVKDQPREEHLAPPAQLPAPPGQSGASSCYAGAY